MDLELAKAVFDRWEDGLPVFEGTFYKAASVLGIDPQAALDEARFYTHFDRYVGPQGNDIRPMTEGEKVYFSCAAGLGVDATEKLAAAEGLLEEQAILRTLAARNFVPDLEKLAYLGMEGGPSEGGPAAAAEAPQPAQAGNQEQAEPPSSKPGSQPQPGAQVQQQAPQNRVRPSPMAPMQVPPSAAGNLQQILQEAQQMEQKGQAEQPMGMENIPPPPPPEQKIMQSVPNISPELLPRYSQQLQELEQRTGIPITDPKQVQKFVQQLEKTDKKMIDEAIKQMAQEQEQQMMAAGYGTPNSFTSMNGAGVPGAGGAPQATPGAPAPGAGGGVPPLPGKKPGMGGAAAPPSPQAITKVAEAGRALARALVQT